MTRLSRLGFGGSDHLANGGAKPAPACVRDSAGDSRQFLAKHPCREYLTASFQAKKKGVATQAVVSWVALASSGVAAKYKRVADEDDIGPVCYASGLKGDAVWVARVKGTGHVAMDRQVLQAVAPVPLSASYLADNCLS